MKKTTKQKTNAQRKNAPKKKAVAPKAQLNGFFSTDIFPHSDRLIAQQQAIEALNANIQRTAKDFKAIHFNEVNGTQQETTVAMDASPNLTFPKEPGNLLNWGVPPSQLTWYANQSFIGYQIAAILMQHWLVDKACTMPARDAVRHGYDVTVNDGTEIDPKVMDRIRRRDKDFNIKGNCVELVRFGRGFGIRIALFEVESPDPLYYEKPFNIDGVTPGSYKGISQIDPYWIVPMLDAQSAANPASKHFYEPTWWLINGRRIHRTHLCIMRNGDELADILKPTYFYGGIPVPQKIAERVFAAERTANEAPMLAMTKRLITLKVDITQAVSNQAQFNSKMEAWTAIMNNYGVKVIGEGEEADVKDTALSDLDAVIMTQYQLVAAAADVPATKLLGTSPKGFGAAGDYEIESYHEMLESIQEHDLSPLVNRHHALLIKSEIAPQFEIPFFHTEVSWKPVDTPTAKEQAEINNIKAERDNKLVQAGAIDGTDVRNRLIADPDSEYSGIEDIVPGGPGDREHEQEVAEKLLENTPAPKEERGKARVQAQQ